MVLERVERPFAGRQRDIADRAEHDHAKNHGQYIQRYLETGEKRAMGKKRRLTARNKDGSEIPIELGLSEILISGGRERMFCAFLTVLNSRTMTDDDEEDGQAEEQAGDADADDGYVMGDIAG